MTKQQQDPRRGSHFSATQNIHRRPPRRKTVTLALLTSCGAALLGWGFASRYETPPPAPALQESASTAAIGSADGATKNATATPTEVLASIPDVALAKPTSVDREIARWKGRAGQSPQDVAAWVNLGDALMQKAREAVDPHYHDHAEKAYRQALALDPARSGAMTGMAWVCGGRHQFPESIDWAQKAIALDPRDNAAYGLIGDAQVEQGEYDAAFENYQKMLDLRPDIASYSRGAQLLYLTGDTRKAMWLMLKAVKAGGPYAENTAWCRARLGEMLLSTGAVLPAESVLKDALKATPGNHHVLLAMGRVKEARKDLTGAIALYKKAAQATLQTDALIRLGDAYRATGKTAEAEAAYAQAETAHEQHKAKHGSSGGSNGGDYDELHMARFFADHDRHLDRALQIAEARKDAKGPTDAETVAWVFYKNNRLPEARAAIDRALAVGKPDAGRLYRAGMIYAKQGDEAAAKRYLSEALTRDPNFSLLEAPVAAETLKKVSRSAAASVRVAAQQQSSNAGNGGGGTP